MLMKKMLYLEMLEYHYQFENEEELHEARHYGFLEFSDHVKVEWSFVEWEKETCRKIFE